MEDQAATAQQIYVDNLGSVFYMARNGVLDTYRACQVSPEQEMRWRQELVQQMALSLEQESLKKLSNLAAIAPYHGDSIIIEAVVLYVMNNLDRMDSYARLAFAGQMWEMAGTASRDLPGGAFSQARSMALRLWQNIISNPVTLDPDSSWELNEDNVSREEYIRREARKCLENAS